MQQVIYDPRSPVKGCVAATIVDDFSNRFGWPTLATTAMFMVPALTVGGIFTVMAEYGCAGLPDWCAELAPTPMIIGLARPLRVCVCWCCSCPQPSLTQDEVNALSTSSSQLPCDGLGGRSYHHHCETKCDSNWVIWMMMCVMFSIMFAFVIILLRNSGPTMHDEDEPSLSTRCVNFCLGPGQFCVEDDVQTKAVEVIRPPRRPPQETGSEAASGRGGLRRLMHGGGSLNPQEREALRSAPIHLMDRSLSYHHRSGACNGGSASTSRFQRLTRPNRYHGAVFIVFIPTCMH
jgi:hypothetical protein